MKVIKQQNSDVYKAPVENGEYKAVGYFKQIQSSSVIFQSDVPGTYLIQIHEPGEYDIKLIGGGGGGFYWRRYNFTTTANGGSSAYIHGRVILSAGEYQIHIGKGGEGSTHYGSFGINGEDSIFLNNIAGGGEAALGTGGGPGGEATVVSSGLTGENGIQGSTVGWINSYGAGGNGSGDVNGKNGYCEIIKVN